MVKIRLKPIVLGLMIFIFLMNTAYAETKLNFSDVDVKVGGRTSNNLKNGNDIREDAKPGDNLEFRVEMKNTYTSAENLKINDITVNVRVEGLDDGEDIDKDSNEFDLSPGSTKRVVLKFQVPLEIDEESLDVVIQADGEDRNGTSQENEMTLRLNIDKESHKVMITRNTLSPAEISCSRKNIGLAVTLLNIGSEDEDEVNVQISNSELGIDIKDSIGELRAEPNEPESRFSKIYKFNVPANIEAGSYPIDLRVLYNDDRKVTEVSQTLTINDCSTQVKQENRTQYVDTSSQPDTAQDRTTVVVQQVPPDTVVSSEGFFKSNGFVIAVVIAEIIAVVIGIALLVSLFGRR